MSDTARDQWVATMSAMNAQYESAGAITEFEDGSRGITPGVMPAEFDAMYSTLTTVGTARGWC